MSPSRGGKRRAAKRAASRSPARAEGTRRGGSKASPARDTPRDSPPDESADHEAVAPRERVAALEAELATERAHAAEASPRRRSSPWRTCGCSKSSGEEPRAGRVPRAPDGDGGRPPGDLQLATELEPAAQAIADSAFRLCECTFTGVFRFDGELLRWLAGRGTNPEAEAALRSFWPRSPDRRTLIGRAFLGGETSHVHAAAADAEYGASVPVANRDALVIRSFLGVPLMREGQPVGVIGLTRSEVRPFSPREIALVQTFADQAVIAIENARLFTELQERTAALTHSVGQLTALGEVGQAVSSSLELGTVLTTIVSRAVHLCGAAGGAIYEYDEAAEEFQLRAIEGLTDEYLEIARQTPPKKGEGATGRLAITPEPIEISDITAPGAYESRLKEILVRTGYRGLLAVPLLREGRVLGSLVVLRTTAGSFEPEVVSLLQDAEELLGNVGEGGWARALRWSQGRADLQPETSGIRHHREEGQDRASREIAEADHGLVHPRGRVRRSPRSTRRWRLDACARDLLGSG